VFESTEHNLAVSAFRNVFMLEEKLVEKPVDENPVSRDLARQHVHSLYVSERCTVVCKSEVAI
jgi:hypothetical protein